MSKYIGVTVPDYIWNKTLGKFPHKNRSELVAELLLLGAEVKERENPAKLMHLSIRQRTSYVVNTQFGNYEVIQKWQKKNANAISSIKNSKIKT